MYRRLFRKYIVWNILLVLLLGASIPVGAAVVEQNLSNVAPMNLTLVPINGEFSQSLEERSSESLLDSVRVLTDEGWGYIPPPVAPMYLQPSTTSPAGTSYPAVSDPRSNGRATPMKNQGLCKSAWAFAAYASMQSSMPSGSEQEFVESDLLSKHGFDVHSCDGGNEFMTTAYLARRGGPINESATLQNPTLTGTAASRQPTPPLLADLLLLPDRSGPLDNDALKWAITQYGGVYTTMYWQKSYVPFLDPHYSSLEHTYSCSSDNRSNNYAVT
ncbi:MAG TPA: C1 family peptidase, partial [Methanomicrobiales archaeon]|nr:C1 family peptidase [Methanomicrobiales archaeon]